MFNDALAYFAEHPLQAAVLLAALLLCAYAWVRALRQAKKRAAAKAKLIETLEHEKKLRQDFKCLDRSLLAETPAERLVEGVCCHIQMALEAAPDMEEAFAALAEPERLIYALGYVVQDSRKGLSAFFRANGKPLTPAALEAVERLVGGEYAAVFREACAAFDEDDEDASYSKAKARGWDEAFAALLRGREDQLYSGAKDYIIAHF